VLRRDSVLKNLKTMRVASRERLTGLLGAYAIVLCAAVWIYAVAEAAADYRRVFKEERERLGSVSYALAAEVDAMLGDGFGAAVAGANELAAAGGAERST